MGKQRAKKTKEPRRSRHPARTKVIKEQLKRFEPRTDGQWDYVVTMQQHPITLAVGPAGCGKTFLAVVEAVRSLSEGEVDKIILTRPAIEAAGERLGHLPGDEIEKVAPYIRPLGDSLEKILGKEATHRLIDLGVIEVVPLAFMRGMTIDGFVVMDEAQNANVDQFKMLMTRLGKHSKLVVTGDLAQSDVVDVKRHIRSGLEDAVVRFAYEDEIATVRLDLSDCQRHDLVRRIIKMYELQVPPDLSYEDICKTRKQLSWWKNDVDVV